MPATTASPPEVLLPPTNPLAWKVTPLRLNSGLNSLKDNPDGPPELRNKLLSARCGWIGVMLSGCINCDCRSSLTRAISWRCSTEYESARKRCAEKLLGSVLTDFHPSTNASS